MTQKVGRTWCWSYTRLQKALPVASQNHAGIQPYLISEITLVLAINQADFGCFSKLMVVHQCQHKQHEKWAEGAPTPTARKATGKGVSIPSAAPSNFTSAGPPRQPPAFPGKVQGDRGYDGKLNSEWVNERGGSPIIHKRKPKSGLHGGEYTTEAFPSVRVL